MLVCLLCCSGPLPDEYGVLHSLQVLDITDSGLAATSANSQGNDLPIFAVFTG